MTGPVELPEPVSPPSDGGLDEAVRVEVLSRGELDVVGRLVDASNATLLATVTLDGVTARCVYKPIAGERPLWDFPPRTLANREVAAYLLSAGAGWDVVPVTVLRDGPYGPGSAQWWVEEPGSEPADPGAGLVDVTAPDLVPADWRRVLRADGPDGRAVVLAHADHPVLRRMALFDVVVNNADRKGGHVVRDDTAVYGVDHGLTFNIEDKLRTVLWGWAGERLAAADRELVAALAADLDGEGAVHTGLRPLLAPDELRRTAHRARRLAATGRYPRPPVGRTPIPWPAF